ncbi:hypothetical protein [Weissella confusa]|uniref:hypothetical protein n=1 Tax=Weissella confusa TaxID=1583 RepID=UPI0021A95420|nr:hypothetical protein [Weissella confusa]MCT2910682.1 hypothetical protein [Weissella confusa]
MINWKKMAISLAAVVGTMGLAGTAYGSDEVFLTDSSQTMVAELGNGYQATWHTPLYTESREALDKKLSDPEVRTEIVREAGFTINGQIARTWHPGESQINGQSFDGYLSFKDNRIANIGSTARVAVKFNNVYSIQFVIFYETSANSDHSESWYSARDAGFTIQEGQRPNKPEDPSAPQPEVPAEGITTWPIDAPDFSDWITLPSIPLQTPDTGDVLAPSTPDQGDQTINGDTEDGKGDVGNINIAGNTEGGKADTGDILAPIYPDNGIVSAPSMPDTGAIASPVVDEQNNTNESNGGNDVAASAGFSDDATLLTGSYVPSGRPMVNYVSSNNTQGSTGGRNLIHDMIVSDDAKRSNALKMEQAGVGSEWITMVAGAILGFLFAFFRRRKEEERDEENEA